MKFPFENNEIHRLEVGLRLGEAMKSTGKKQSNISEEFNVTQQKICNWIQGRHYPDFHFILNFCYTYRVSMDWIYSGSIFNACEDPRIEEAFSLIKNVINESHKKIQNAKKAIE